MLENYVYVFKDDLETFVQLFPIELGLVKKKKRIKTIPKNNTA